MSETLDDSILNIEEIAATGNAANYDMNEDIIAELLSDDVADNGNRNNVEDVEMEEVIPEEVVVAEAVPAAAENVIVEEIIEEVLLDESSADEGFEETDGPVEEVVIEEDVIEEDSIGDASLEEIAVLNEEEEEEAPIVENIILESDDEIFEEEVLHVEDAVGDETSSRKRPLPETEQTPAHKRNRPDRPFFEARKKAIDLITSLYGSWDASLTVPHLRTITDMRRKQFNTIIDMHVENENKLKAHVALLQQEIHKERQAHAITTSALKDLTKETQNMRATLKTLSGMITQPPTEEIFATFNTNPHPVERVIMPVKIPIPYRTPQPTLQRHPSNMTSVSQQISPHYQQDPPRRFQESSYQETAKRHILQQRRIQAQTQNGGPSGNVSVVRSAEAVRTLSQAYLPPNASAAAIVNNPPLKFPSIPQPNPPMGHTHQVAGPHPQHLIDVSKPSDNTIMLCVPYVPNKSVISCGDSSRLPLLPKVLSSLSKTPDLTVTISSTAQDFRENWQIAGKINYEYMGMLDKKTIQVFVQVASLKAAGMWGRPNPNNPLDNVNWGISKAWPCKAKSHRYRVSLHQWQQLPINDRITIVVVARNSVTGAIEISDAVYLNLT